MAPSHSRIKNPKMDQDFFTSLPTEIMLDIVLRLPTRSIMSCKCVCKSCRDLISSREFVESHSSRPIGCLAHQNSTLISRPYKIIEFVDSQNSWQNQCNEGLYFSFPCRTTLHSSANGLLFLINTMSCSDKLFICNPITREYIKLPPPIVDCHIIYPKDLGFGVSRLTSEYKVVRLGYEENHRTSQRKCEVYTLRRGLWRSVEIAGDRQWYCQRMRVPISLNGNLHWLVHNSNSDNHYRRILCFDLETERFSTFSIPYLDLDYRSICALGGCLCLYDSSCDGFVIWLMNKYGDDKSWTKKFVINRKISYDLNGDAVPIKVFINGDILFVCRDKFSLYYYSSKSKTIRTAESFITVGSTCTYAPSFLPLKTLTMENNVISF